MNPSRPLALVDLDDTLFQTGRHMADGPRHVATLDIHGAPMSYMTPVQKTFVDWLLTSTDVVPVTARSVEAYQRVQVPFAGPAVTTHGGVILDAHGMPDPAWQAHMARALAGYQDRLLSFVAILLRAAEPLGLSLRTWAVVENDLAMYVVAKQNGGDEARLTDFAATLPQFLSLDGFYLHLNNNNLAILPTPLTKRRAVDEILRRDRERWGERPVIGLGDSLSDLGFLDTCHWWGTPRTGQVARWVDEQLATTRHAATVSG
ncbi:MAG: trehalose phosphatase [Candidatus Sericytochromatia bacterium]|nr:trehalose phosphatase [Candidatus Sericytochromatia bacterium]